MYKLNLEPEVLYDVAGAAKNTKQCNLVSERLSHTGMQCLSDGLPHETQTVLQDNTTPTYLTKIFNSTCVKNVSARILLKASFLKFSVSKNIQCKCSCENLLIHPLLCQSDMSHENIFCDTPDNSLGLDCFLYLPTI